MPRTPKYRRLSAEQLHELEKEFIEFLIVNGITAEEWIRIKKEELEKAEDLIILFSDVVFEGILRKVSFLEYRGTNQIHVFQCLKDKMILMALETDDPNIDLSKSIDSLPKAGIRVFSSEKCYSKPREQELFEMTNNKGCEISDGKMFKVIAMAKVGKD